MNNLFSEASKWFYSDGPKDLASTDNICQTRDIFQSRLDRFFRDLLKKKFSPDECGLIISVIGELGNNTFDHNLGSWKDQPGCWFETYIDGATVYVMIADRGRGLLGSLKKVVPQLKSDQEAVDVGFDKIISGRAPEKRGNGLKYVRAVINGHINHRLHFISGQGIAQFGTMKTDLGKTLEERIVAKPQTGALALLGWRFS